MSAAPSFWEHRPWLGAGIFAALLLGVGLFLALMIGERQHYRSEWRLISELPSQGRLEQGTPFEWDPVNVQVLVRVDVDGHRPGVGLEAVLLTPGDGTHRVVSRGVTAPPGGHALLPVPARLDPSLFRGELQVGLLLPGESLMREAVPVPRKGECTVAFELEGRCAARIAVRDDEGRRLRARGRVRTGAADGSLHPWAGGIPLVDGSAQVGGLPRGRPLRFVVAAEGYEETVLRREFRTEEPPTVEIQVTLVPLPLLASGRVLQADGRPAGGALVGFEVLALAPDHPVVRGPTVATDHDGTFVLYGRIPESKFHLVAWGEGTAGRTVLLKDPPEEGVILTLRPTGSVSGSVEAAHGMLELPVTVGLVAEGASPDALLHFTEVPAGIRQGAFTFDGVPSGRYDLVALVPGRAALRLPAVEVRPGERAPDPRVQRIRLE